MAEKTSQNLTSDLLESPNPGEKVLKVDSAAEAGRIIADIEHRMDMRESNQGTKSESKSSDGDGWRKEPIRNFVTDLDGKVVVNADGSPKRKACRPAVAKTGDTLADGSLYEGGSNRLVIPDPPTSPPPDAGEAGNAEQDGVGEEAVKVITGGVFRAVKAIKPDAAPTFDEQTAIEKSFGGWLGRARFPWWIVAVLATGFYVTRVVLQGKRNDSKSVTKEQGKDNGQHSGDRADRDRQDAPNKVACYAGF